MIWTVLAHGMSGFIVLVDSTKPETFPEAKSIIEALCTNNRGPYILAANKQDLPGASSIDEVRAVLQLPDKIKVLPCIATSPE